MVSLVNFLPVRTFSYMPWVKHVNNIRVSLSHEAVHLLVAIRCQARDTEVPAVQCLRAVLQTDQLYRIG